MAEQPCEYCGQQAEIYCSHTWNYGMAECARLVCTKCAQLNDWHITPTGSPDNETLCPEHLEITIARIAERLRAANRAAAHNKPMEGAEGEVD